MTAHVYTVHLRRSAPPPGDGDLVLVRDGFNWWAFLFSVPWALYNRMWAAAALIFSAQVVFGIFAKELGYNDATASALSLGIAVMVGLSACDLRAWTLKRKGYEADGVVVAASLYEAERRYLDARPELAAGMVGA
ncbi:MAG: DUF2628 domain-containing protein [Rhodospirillaceae bacterium]|nr:DUF2628 domain-containing protein [Rhodospirillaceae bacterium]